MLFDRDFQLKPAFFGALQDRAIPLSADETAVQNAVIHLGLDAIYPEEETIVNVYKTLDQHNPVMVQRFGADPWAMVYDGRVYLYMTGDERYGELGHAAYMKFKSTQTSRSVFYVQEETQYTNCMPVIMGHNTGACFYRVSHYNGNPITPTASGLLYGHYLAEQFVAGDFRMNSVNVPFNHGEPGGFARPIVYSAATVANADTVSFNRLMRDRDIKWGGARVGELMMYDSRLTTEQIRQNNAYLSKKWLGGMEEEFNRELAVYASDTDVVRRIENQFYFVEENREYSADYINYLHLMELKDRGSEGEDEFWWFFDETVNRLKNSYRDR